MGSHFNFSLSSFSSLSLSIRSHSVDTQSIPSRPESNPEVESLSCVYDNDCVVEMQATRAQQYQNRTRVDLREGEMQPLARVQWSLILCIKHMTFFFISPAVAFIAQDLRNIETLLLTFFTECELQHGYLSKLLIRGYLLLRSSHSRLSTTAAVPA